MSSGHDLIAQPVIDFTRHWGSDEAGDGDWEIFGSFTGVVPCPAEAISGLLAALSGRQVGQADAAAAGQYDRTLAAMRKFQAGDYRSLACLSAGGL